MLTPLSRIPLFADLDEIELKALASHAVTRIFPKHAILISEGDRSDSLYIILSGTVKVFASDEDGNEVLLNLLGPGEYFGELALIDTEPRSASIMTREPCKLMIIARGDFNACLEKHVSIAFSLLRVLAGRLRHKTDDVKNLVLMSTYARVVKALNELAEKRDGQRIIEPVTHRLLAEKAYASRAMITLILKELKQGGYISTDHKRIVIEKKLPEKR